MSRVMDETSDTVSVHASPEGKATRQQEVPVSIKLLMASTSQSLPDTAAHLAAWVISLSVLQ